MDNVAGNLYDKYATRNPVARYLMSGYLSALTSLLPEDIGPTSQIIEVGCGEGHLLNYVNRHYHNKASCLGYDIDEDIIRKAREEYPELRFETESAYDVASDTPVALVLACEVLEHLAGPDKAMEALAALPCENYIFSVPREPLWRCLNLARFSYVRDLGNTPGHVHHWNRSAFTAFVGRYFKVQDVLSPVPWTLVRASR